MKGANSLVLTTQDNLELWFLLDGNVAESIAAALVSALAEHGRSPVRPERLKH
jgi:hypothetical protein